MDEPEARGSFACPCCGTVTYHSEDIRNGYCGMCHTYTGDPVLGPIHLEGPCIAREEAIGYYPKARRMRQIRPEDLKGDYL